jgi:hypothetical protein
MRTYTHPPTQPTPGKQEPFCAAPLVPLVLKDGHCYADRWGAVFLIMGDAKGADAERDGLCWSSAGHWFKRSTGQRVRSWNGQGPELSPVESWYTLALEVPRHG